VVDGGRIVLLKRESKRFPGGGFDDEFEKAGLAEGWFTVFTVDL